MKFKKLTKKNYYQTNNGWLTNSKINDWLKDKCYFYRKNILGTVPPKKTDAMLIGSAVDEWLTKGRKSFDKKYKLVSRRTSGNDYELNQTQYDHIVKMCEKIEIQDAYKSLKKHKKQVILSYPLELGRHFAGIAGMPDFLKINGNHANIVDLKTSAEMDSINKYHWHCENFGYYRQAAMYSLLVYLNYPEITDIICNHLVVEKDSDGIYNVFTYILSDDRIKFEINKILNTLPEVAHETKFAARNASWFDAVTIGGMEKYES